MAIEDMDELRKIYEETSTIAVVGASADETKAAHSIPRYLQRQGFRIIPVNPKGGEILGEKVHERLEDIPEPIDVVDVFRPSAETPAAAADRAKVRTNALLAQEVTSPD